MYNYVKALHIIFIVTWFSGLFYIVRLFIYNAEANQRQEPERTIILEQLLKMTRLLWKVITWPSAILTLIFGPWTMILMGSVPSWLVIKLCFVAGLYAYHLSLQMIYNQQMKGDFRYSSQQLRIWNEVATIFLVAIVMLAVVKQNMSWAWGLTGFFAFVIVLMSAVQLYKKKRKPSRR